MKRKTKGESSGIEIKKGTEGKNMLRTIARGKSNFQEGIYIFHPYISTRAQRCQGMEEKEHREREIKEGYRSRKKEKEIKDISRQHAPIPYISTRTPIKEEHAVYVPRTIIQKHTHSKYLWMRV